MTLHQRGWSFKEISKEMKRNRKTIYAVWQRYKKEGDFKKAKRTKHHRRTSDEEDEAIVDLILNQPTITAREVIERLSLQVTEATVRNRMNEIGLHGKIMGRKGRLSYHHVQERFNFAVEYLNEERLVKDFKLYSVLFCK